MATENEIKQAKAVYEKMCKALDSKGWKFKRFDEDLTISLGVRGDDLPMDLIMRVNTGAQVVSVFSPMGFKISEDKRVEAALAVCVANYGLVNGSFDYDINDGEIRFRATQSFRESITGDEVFEYLLAITNFTVDKYNDRFLMLSKGMIDLKKFIEMENAEQN
ncbi:MAG: hypothetical protein E7491_06260 [Ruminococcaceae bacterium]|nr:hypothetical protein [Oscillospiraceae bacterium]